MESAMDLDIMEEVTTVEGSITCTTGPTMEVFSGRGMLCTTIMVEFVGVWCIAEVLEAEGDDFI